MHTHTRWSPRRFATAIPVHFIFGFIVVIVIQRAEIGLCYGHTISNMIFKYTFHILRVYWTLSLSLSLRVCVFLLLLLSRLSRSSRIKSAMTVICSQYAFVAVFPAHFVSVFFAFALFSLAVFSTYFYISLFLLLLFVTFFHQCRCHFVICKWNFSMYDPYRTHHFDNL